MFSNIYNIIVMPETRTEHRTSQSSLQWRLACVLSPCYRTGSAGTQHCDMAGCHGDVPNVKQGGPRSVPRNSLPGLHLSTWRERKSPMTHPALLLTTPTSFLDYRTHLWRHPSPVWTGVVPTITTANRRVLSVTVGLPSGFLATWREWPYVTSGARLSQ